MGTVKTFLGYPSVDLKLGDRDGRSLVSLTAGAGYEDVLRMNGANADPNFVDGGRLIPLSRVAAGWWRMGRWCSDGVMDCAFSYFPTACQAQIG